MIDITVYIEGVQAGELKNNAAILYLTGGAKYVNILKCWTIGEIKMTANLQGAILK